MLLSLCVLFTTSMCDEMCANRHLPIQNIHMTTLRLRVGGSIKVSKPTMDHTVLDFDDKLRIAIETLLTGQLKDNHDDTLFEKLCSLLMECLKCQMLNFFYRFIENRAYR